MPEAMAQPGLYGPEISHDGDSNPTPTKPPVKESSYYMDNYEATVTVHTSPPQQYHVTQSQQLQQQQNYGGEFLEIDDETRDLPESRLVRNKLSKKKNLRVTFSDHIEVDLIPDLYDDVDGDVDEDIVVEESVYELVKTPGSNKLTRGAKLKEPIPIQTHKPMIIAHGSPELKIAKENVSPNRSPPGSPRKSEQRSKVTSPRSNKVTTSSSSPPLLHRRRISQSSMNQSSDSERPTTKDYLHELRERRQNQNQKQTILNTLLPNLHSPKSRSQPSYSNFLSDAKRAVDRANFVHDRPWARRSPEKPVYGLYNQNNADIARSAGTVRKTTSLPRNFRLPETLYSGRYRRPGSDNTLLNLGVK